MLTQIAIFRPSTLLLPVALVATTACTPGCSPPEAEPPITAQKADSTLGESAGAEPPAAADMIMDAKGVDTSSLSEAQRTSFFQMINMEPSACGEAHSLAKSLRDDADCRDSLVVAQFIAERVGSGVTPSDVKLELDEIVDALRVREIPIEGRPVFGNERAPVTVVVFADFECPHCRSEAPIIRKAIESFRGQAKMVYRHFPLSGHARARVAAIATEAAHSQGKFFQMHDQVFAHQTQLEDADLEKYAKSISGLDFAKWKTEFQARKGEAQVEADRKAGEELQITGTPAVFINGRYFHPALFGGTVEGWIEDALRR
jgi:protein-disulfide isomerase